MPDSAYEYTGSDKLGEGRVGGQEREGERMDEREGEGGREREGKRERGRRKL